MNEKFSSLEATIHLARYNMALPLCKGKKVLDVACGEGYGSYMISNAGASEVVGVDIDKKTIEKAKTNFKNNNLKYEVSDATNLSSIKDNYFDVIVSFETFEHVKDVDKFLKEIKRVANADAIIIITCPNDYFYYKENESNPFHYAKYHFDEFKEKCESYLGNNVKYYVGIHCEGFLNYDCTALQNNTKQKDMILNNYNSSSFIVPSEEKINYDDCNYYIGIWNYKKFESNNALYPTNNNKDVLSLINSLNEQVDVFKNDCEKLNNNISVLNNINTDLKQQLFDSKSNNEELNNKLDANKSKIEELERYKQLYNLTREELIQLRKYNLEQYQAVEELKKNVEELRKSNEELIQKSEYWEKMYNMIVNSRTYRYARKIVKLVKGS